MSTFLDPRRALHCSLRPRLRALLLAGAMTIAGLTAGCDDGKSIDWSKTIKPRTHRMPPYALNSRIHDPRIRFYTTSSRPHKNFISA